MSLTNIVSQSVTSSFIYLIAFRVQKFLILTESNLFFSILWIVLLTLHLKNFCLAKSHKGFPYVSSRNFVAGGCMFRSIVHFMFVLKVWSISWNTSFIYGYQIFQKTYIKQNTVSPWTLPMPKINWVYFWTVYFVSLIYLFVLPSISHCLDYWSFMICLIINLLVLKFCSVSKLH